MSLRAAAMLSVRCNSNSTITFPETSTSASSAPISPKKPSWTTFNNQTTYQGKRSNGQNVTAIVNYFNSTGGMAVNGSPYDNGGSAWAHWWDYGYVQDFDGGSIGNCAIFDTGHRVQMGFWQTYLQGNNHHHLRF